MPASGGVMTVTTGSFSWRLSTTRGWSPTSRSTPGDNRVPDSTTGISRCEVLAHPVKTPTPSSTAYIILFTVFTPSLYSLRMHARVAAFNAVSDGLASLLASFLPCCLPRLQTQRKTTHHKNAHSQAHCRPYGAFAAHLHKVR